MEHASRTPRDGDQPDPTPDGRLPWSAPHLTSFDVAGTANSPNINSDGGIGEDMFS